MDLDVQAPPCPTSVQSVIVAFILCPDGSAVNDGATIVWVPPGPSVGSATVNAQALTSWNPSLDVFCVSLVTVSFTVTDMDLKAIGPVFVSLIRVHQAMHMP